MFRDAVVVLSAGDLSLSLKCAERNQSRTMITLAVVDISLTSSLHANPLPLSPTQATTDTIAFELEFLRSLTVVCFLPPWSSLFILRVYLWYLVVHQYRDLVSDPSYREDLKLALKMRLDPWINCEEADE